MHTFVVYKKNVTPMRGAIRIYDTPDILSSGNGAFIFIFY